MKSGIVVKISFSKSCKTMFANIGDNDDPRGILKIGLNILSNAKNVKFNIILIAFMNSVLGVANKASFLFYAF